MPCRLTVLGVRVHLLGRSVTVPVTVEVKLIALSLNLELVLRVVWQIVFCRWIIRMKLPRRLVRSEVLRWPLMKARSPWVLVGTLLLGTDPKACMTSDVTMATVSDWFLALRAVIPVSLVRCRDLQSIL